MKKYFFIAGLFTLTGLYIAGCGSPSAEPKVKNSTSAPTETSSAPVEETYKKNCMSCHGPDGDLGISGAKKFSESVMEQNDRVMIITHGKGSMPSFENKLSEQEIKDLAAYTMTLGNK